MKTIFQRGIALSLVMALFLCACAALPQPHARPDKSESGSAEAAFPTVTDKLKPENPVKEPAASEQPEEQAVPAPPPAEQNAPPVQVAFSEEAKQSLVWLRDRMDFPEVMFGIAFLGYVGEASNGDWLSAADQAMLGQYPFISEIDAAHTIESDDNYLYCLVPLDENATVSINLVKWDPDSEYEEILDVLYHSESGEPILFLAACGDDAYAYLSYIQVQIVNSDGSSCVWYPQLDAMGHIIPCLSESGDYASFDFTEYGWLEAPSELSSWLSEGYGGVYATGLGGCWTTQATAWNTSRPATYFLWFFPEDETGGTIDVYWEYEDADPTSVMWEEVWTGFFTLTAVMDGVSYATIDLSLVGGNRYGVVDGPYDISETYPLVISPSCEELVLGAGENGVSLPFMPQNESQLCTLTLESWLTELG